jgi:hypothetical protein
VTPLLTPSRGIVAEFYKSSGGRLKLFSITTLTPGIDRHDGLTYISRTGYDVELSRRFGYIWHESSWGGERIIEVSGIYFVSGDVEVKETPTQLVDASDEPPWKSSRTLAIRRRNKTRRLSALPKAFAISEGQDLIDWMENNAIADEPVWCSTCRDWVTGNDLCAHTWWCDSTGQYSTPSERCKCKDRDECREEVL